ncbi:MAG: hypothetical protein ABR534_11565, partial [Desulfotignum sp.]
MWLSLVSIFSGQNQNVNHHQWLFARQQLMRWQILCPRKKRISIKGYIAPSETILSTEECIM